MRRGVQFATLMILVGVMLGIGGCANLDLVNLAAYGRLRTSDVQSLQVQEAPSVTPVPSPTLLSDAAIDEMYDAAERLTIDVYKRVSPSVVNVTSQIVEVGFFGLYPTEGSGSGFVIDYDGHILTNYHVIEGAESIEVTLLDQTVATAEVVGVDAVNDLAVIRVDVDQSKLHPLPIDTTQELQVGQRAIAIGNPFGLNWTLTTGVISSLGRPLQVSQTRTIYNVVQTDAAINPGNSGGPLLNSHGQLIGVNTAIQYDAENIGFAIPISTVRRVVPELISSGRYPHPWLGIDGYTLFPELARQLDLPVDRGILIVTVYSGTAGQEAGLQGATQEAVYRGRRVYLGGDVLVAVDGHVVNSNQDLLEILETQTRVGQEVEIAFYRGDELLTSRARLGERP